MPVLLDHLWGHTHELQRHQMCHSMHSPYTRLADEPACPSSGEEARCLAGIALIIISRRPCDDPISGTSRLEIDRRSHQFRGHCSREQGESHTRTRTRADLFRHGKARWPSIPRLRREERSPALRCSVKNGSIELVFKLGAEELPRPCRVAAAHRADGAANGPAGAAGGSRKSAARRHTAGRGGEAALGAERILTAALARWVTDQPVTVRCAH
eukprot:scaffold312665_cov27-Tisochrysis_lutea.AAC.3